MSEVKWIKIVTNIFDDEKILLIETLPEADGIIVIWFKLLCLAGKQNNSGVFMLSDKMPYSEKMFATIFRRKESTVRLALETFQRFGMVEIVEGTVTIPNWGKHQSLDKIEANKEYMRKYMREYREKQKGLTGCKVNSKANSKPNGKTNVRPLDKNREDKTREDKPPYPLAEFNFSEDLEAKILEWLTYKKEKKDTYKPTGFKSLLGQIRKNADQHGDETVIGLIDECMSNNWKGIIWDKLEKVKKKNLSHEGREVDSFEIPF